MSRRNSQKSQARPPGLSTTPAWEQQQQQQQHHATSNDRRTSNLFTGRALPTSQEIVNTFVLERYSRHNPTTTTTTTANAFANLGSSGCSGSTDLDSCRPLLLIHTGNDILESLGLDRASVRSSKLRGVVKGSMIGFRYTSSSSSSASASLAPAPGSSQSESHKFQIKFNTLADCGQCSSLLSSWIECQSVAPQGSPSTQLATTAITTSAASTSTSSQTLVQSSQDTDVTMAPPPLPSPSPHLAQATHNNNSNAMRFGSTHTCSQQAGTGATTGIPSPSTYSASSSPQSTAPTPVGTSVYVGSEELAHILRSAATNSIVLTQTAPATTSMSSPPLRQHQQQQQRNRQARLSLTPQSTPMAMVMPVSSPSSSIAASRLTARMSSMAPSDGGGQSLQSSVDASCQQRNIEIHDGSVHNNVNVSHNDGISVSTSTTNDDDLSILLNLPNDKLQEDIDSILHDPLFQDLLLKVDLLLRGPVSKR
ncbi:hypothetical protein F5H01DRAFT_379043 [Linnemannia elongata]|nr:hypothetical protein F5H01DRAFT_379043 [Linnemannia elongata]